MAEPEEILSVLNELNKTISRVLLVGHNPGLEKLLAMVKNSSKNLSGSLGGSCGDNLGTSKIMTRATLAKVELTEDWMDLQNGGAKLSQLVRASSLKDKFPYPDIGGSKTRSRPAYYYTQSGVIPYRIKDGRLEVMIVSSSNNKHWVIPKGIVDPGHTPQESAIKEAFEEAGIKGFVDDQELGVYKYRKWGATCIVAVYPMEVTYQLPKSKWEENHRKRKWVPPKQAIKLLPYAEIKLMIKSLQGKVSSQNK
jgi:phosphohistidine phosphatase